MKAITLAAVSTAILLGGTTWVAAQLGQSPSVNQSQAPATTDQGQRSSPSGQRADEAADQPTDISNGPGKGITPPSGADPNATDNHHSDRTLAKKKHPQHHHHDLYKQAERSSTKGVQSSLGRESTNWDIRGGIGEHGPAYAGSENKSAMGSNSAGTGNGNTPAPSGANPNTPTPGQNPVTTTPRR